MNGKKLAGIVIVILLIVAGAVWASMGQKNAGNETTGIPKTTETQSTSGNKTLKELFSQNKDITCSAKYQSEGTDSEGRIYLSSGNMRGDFTMVSQGQTQKTSMISKDNMVYSWMEGQKTGFKMQAVASEAQGADSKTPIDQDTAMQVSCDDWKVDKSKFDLPSGVEFTDLNAMMQTLPASPAGQTNPAGSPTMDLSEIQKAACASLSEPEKTQCLQAIQ